MSTPLSINRALPWRSARRSRKSFALTVAAQISDVFDRSPVVFFGKLDPLDPLTIPSKGLQHFAAVLLPKLIIVGGM